MNLPPGWRSALLLGGVVGIVYTSIVFGYSVFFSPDISISGPLWQSFMLYVVMSLGTVGVPVTLWITSRVWSPLALLAAILLFFHALIEYPPIGTGEGDAPGFLFVFMGVPIYLLAYVVLTVVETRLRGGGIVPFLANVS